MFSTDSLFKSTRAKKVNAAGAGKRASPGFLGAMVDPGKMAEMASTEKTGLQVVTAKTASEARQEKMARMVKTLLRLSPPLRHSSATCSPARQSACLSSRMARGYS